MSEKLATLKKDGDISTIILDDGKANVFSTKMSEDINMCLDEVPLENGCLLYTSPSPRDSLSSRMPSSA